MQLQCSKFPIPCGTPSKYFAKQKLHDSINSFSGKIPTNKYEVWGERERKVGSVCVCVCVKNGRRNLILECGDFDSLVSSQSVVYFRHGNK
jgi:hypothetical protein